MPVYDLPKLARLIRYLILKSTTTAGSGHPTSSLSAADLMTALFFGGYFRFDFSNPQNMANDRLVFSKGHATPLYYSLFVAAGAIEREDFVNNYRKFGSIFEGHPTANFPLAEAATGSLGQGLSVGVGLALGIKKYFHDNYPETKEAQLPRAFVLLGDGELAEGSIWEAANIASYYKLTNLTAIVDVNRLGQTSETAYGWNTEAYRKRFESFGWEAVEIDGHNYQEIIAAFDRINNRPGSIKPFAIVAKTIKGKGISFLEDKPDWHGKPLPEDLFAKAIDELGNVDYNLIGKTSVPSGVFILQQQPKSSKSIIPLYKIGDKIATRKAFGQSLAGLGEDNGNIISLDAEVSNSTYSEIFKKKFPDRFFEMFIAEQNMVGTAAGMSRLGYIPFVSTFSAFLTRSFDQIRMAALSCANIKFIGSHAGVSIGADGPSQMGLEDIAMFRSTYNSIVLYPADAVATSKLLYEMLNHRGISYLRTTRSETPVIYKNEEGFPIGGFKVHQPKLPGFQQTVLPILIIAAGITLYEAIKAQVALAQEQGIGVTVIDLYSVKPIDEQALRKLAEKLIHKDGIKTSNMHIITVEDHWFEGGLGDAVLNVFAANTSVIIHKMAVSKMPRSGTPGELLDFEEISAKSITNKIKSLI